MKIYHEFVLIPLLLEVSWTVSRSSESITGQKSKWFGCTGGAGVCLKKMFQVCKLINVTQKNPVTVLIQHLKKNPNIEYKYLL